MHNWCEKLGYNPNLMVAVSNYVRVHNAVLLENLEQSLGIASHDQHPHCATVTEHIELNLNSLALIAPSDIFNA